MVGKCGQLRDSLLTNVCSTVKECQRRFKLFTEQGDVSIIPGDFIDLVFANAVRYGGEEEYEQVLKIYKKPPTPQHKAGCMRALCCARDPKLLDRTIEFMNSDEVKMQDMMYFFGGLAANRVSRRKLWEHLQSNLGPLTARFKGNFSLGRLVQYSFDRLSTKEDEKAISKFFEDKEYVFHINDFTNLSWDRANKGSVRTNDYVQSLKQGLDAVRAKSAWLARDKDDVADWLKSNSMLDS